jgi:hypothetical protein
MFNGLELGSDSNKFSFYAFVKKSIPSRMKFRFKNTSERQFLFPDKPGKFEGGGGHGGNIRIYLGIIHIR